MRLIRMVLLSLLTAIICFNVVGCDAKSFTRTRLHYGLGEVSYELQPLLEPCTTYDYVSDVCGGFGVDSFRIWMSARYMVEREPDSDKVFLNQSNVESIHKLCKALKENGVTQILAMSSEFLYPFDYTPTTYSCVPDPYYEKEFYERFLNIQKETWRLIAEEFKGEITFFEVINEPDQSEHGTIHKCGYRVGETSNNAKYFYSVDEIARICMDINYYVNEGIKSTDKNNKLLMPSLCGYTWSKDYLEAFYKVIESKTIPSGRDYSDTDPDSYFDILNWHPYLLSEGATSMDESWVDLNNGIYNVAKKHGDAKPVWFTELGFSDYGRYTPTDEILVQAFELIKSKLSYVETVIVFRITDLYKQNISAYENSFGMLKSICDPNVTEENVIKKIGETYFRIINGENADLQKLSDKIKPHLNKFK